jgi:hypothetical protein
MYNLSTANNNPALNLSAVLATGNNAIGLNIVNAGNVSAASLTCNSIDTYNPTGDFSINTTSRGTLNIGTAASKSGAINIGTGSGTTSAITIGGGSTTTTFNSSGISVNSNTNIVFNAPIGLNYTATPGVGQLGYTVYDIHSSSTITLSSPGQPFFITLAIPSAGTWYVAVGGTANAGANSTSYLYTLSIPSTPTGTTTNPMGLNIVNMPYSTSYITVSAIINTSSAVSWNVLFQTDCPVSTTKVVSISSFATRIA